MSARLLLTAILLATGTPAAAELTIRQGETWIFTVQRGEPARARKVQPNAAAKAGEIRATLRAMLGTSLTVSNHGKTGYTYRAELLDDRGKATAARACTLPPGGKPTFEHWTATAAAVRLSNFRPAAKGGSCP